MLIEQLIRETLEIKGFRIESGNKVGSELIATIAADLCFHPCCFVCSSHGDYRDTLSERRFRNVPLRVMPVTLVYAPCHTSENAVSPDNTRSHGVFTFRIWLEVFQVPAALIRSIKSAGVEHVEPVAEIADQNLRANWRGLKANDTQD